MKKLLVSLAACAAGCLCAFGLETAESLIVDINVASLSALADGATVSEWPNRATGDLATAAFAPCTAGKGPVYRVDAGGHPGVYFAGSADSTMESPTALPATILGGETWSAEAWFYTPTLPSSGKTYFTWSRRGGGNQLVELRYGNDGGNAVEHHSNNVGWNGIPSAGSWHYFAITRDATGTEDLYVDGVRQNGKSNYTALNVRNNGLFTIGGTKGDGGAFDGGLLYTGYLGAVRVHAGTLTAAQVAANYAEERGAYQCFWKGNDADWSAAGEWTTGRLPGETDVARFVDGGTATVDGGAVTVRGVDLTKGAVVVDGGATFTINADNNINLAKGATADGSFTLAQGTLVVNRRIDASEAGGNVTLTFGRKGAAEGTAVANFPNEFNLTVNGTGTMYIEDGASLTFPAWFTGTRYNSGSPKRGDVVMNGGRVQCNSWYLIATDGGSGSLTMNGGHFVCPGFEFTYNGQSDTQSGILYLNGGTLELSNFQNNNTKGTQQIVFNGGILKARQTHNNFMPANLDSCLVKAGDARIEVPAGFAIDIKQKFTPDAENPGKIVKLGLGRLNLLDSFGYAGAMSVEEGQVKFSKKSNLASVTSLAVAKDGVVMCSEAGGIAELLARLTADSEGTLLIAGENLAEDVDLTRFPKMRVGFAGVSNPYTGKITYAPGVTPVYAFNTCNGATDINTALSDDGATAFGLTLTGLAGSGYKLVLKKDNSFTGGITVDTAMLQFDTAKGMGTTGPIRLVNGGELVLNHADIDVQGVINRLTPDSDGALLFCGSSKKDLSFSLVGHPGIYVGAYPGHNFDYTGTITPDDPNEWHFGGGHAKYDQTDGGFKYKPSATVIADADGKPTTVVFGKPGMSSLFTTSANTYTGGTVVTNDASVYLYNNDAAFGAVPAEPDPDNFYLDGGNIRLGNTTMALSANRGFIVGPNGARFHVWGSQALTLAGSLHGTGPIVVSDSGTLVLAGAANDFAGTIETSSAAIQIGGDTSLSWNFAACTPQITGSGRLILGIPAGQTYDLTAATGGGAGWFGKAGTGTLVLKAKQNMPNTAVKAGTLVVEREGDIGTSGLTLDAGATLEIRNGITLHFDALNGTGAITAPEGTTATIVLGEAGGGGSFTGAIAPNVKIVKAGAGSQTLRLDADRDEVTVNAGTLVLSVPSRIERPVVAEGATLTLSYENPGLTGRYFTDSDVKAAIGNDNWKQAINSHADLVKVWECGAASRVDQKSTEFGDVWNVRGSGTANKFPLPYRDQDYWVAVWRGYFLAETDGDYAFASASDDGTALFIDGERIVSNISDKGLNESQFDTTRGVVTLARGWHLIDLGFYDNTAGNEMAFQLTTPDGTAQYLPNRLVSETTTVPIAIGDTSAIKGAVTLVGCVEFVYDVAGGQTVVDPAIVTPGSAFASVSKDGDGTLEWTACGEGVTGGFHVKGGTLALKNATAVGAITLDADATVTVAPKKHADYRGLSLRYYDSTDNTYSQLETLSRMHTFFEETLTATVAANTYVLGGDTFATDGNPAFREPGKYSTGKDNYFAYATGRIYIPLDGQYAFGFYSDDGIALYVDGTRRYLNKGGCGSAGGNNTGWFSLTQGYHDFEWAFRENSGGQFFSTYLKYKDAAGNETYAPWADWALLPQNLLYPEFSRVAGLSGEGTLDLGRGMLVVEQADDAVFTGDVTAETEGGVTAYLVKRGTGTLALGGAVMANVVSGGGTLVLAPAKDGAYADVVAEEGATVTVSAPGAVSIGRLRGRGTLVVDGGAVVTANASDFAGTVRLVNGRFLAADTSFGKYTVIDDSDEGTPVSAGIAATDGRTVDLTAPDVDTEVTGAKAVVAGAASLALGDAADVTLAPLARQTVNDYGLWQFNGKAEKWTGVDGETGFLVLPGGGNWVGSVYLKEKVDVRQPWRMTWTFVATKGAGSAWGDGVAFVIQNDAAGAGLCDSNCTGGKLGGPCDTTHPLSAAFWWNLYNKESCGWALAGTKGAETTLLNNPSDAQRRTLDGYDLDIAYNGEGVMSCKIYYKGEQVYATTQAIDLKAVVGGGSDDWDGTAYVGFSAGTGGSGAFMSVRNVAWYTGTTREAGEYHVWQDAGISDLTLWQANGTVSPDVTGMKLCRGDVGNTASSIYAKEKRDIRGQWKAHWAFTAIKGSSGTGWGDGVCFALQDDPAGAALCDGIAGNLGGPCNTAHPRSIAFWWNLYQKESCGWAVKGAHTTDTTLLNGPTDAQRRTPNGYDLDIAHDGNGKLTCTISYQGEVVYTQDQAVDFADIFGDGWDGTAYVGLSAAMGGSSNDLWVRDFAWTDWVTLVRDPYVDVSLAENASASLRGFAADEEFGDFALEEGGVLTIRANEMVPADTDYTVTAQELRVRGNATLTLADNGTGKGTLIVRKLVYENGTLTLGGGQIAAAGTTLPLVAPTGFKGRASVIKFASGAVWSGAEPTVTVTDGDGKAIRAKASLKKSGLVLSTESGLQILIY